MKKYLIKVALDHLAFGLTIPISVIWMLSRGINIEQVAVVAAIATIVTLLADIPTGALADKYGRKPSLVLGSMTLGLSLGLLAFSSSFFFFCLYAVLSGIGWALLSGAEEAYIYETSDEEKKNYRNSLGDVTIVDEVATIVGLGAAALLTKYFGLQHTIVIAAVTLGIAAVVSLFALSEPRRHLSDIGNQEKRLMANAARFLKKHSKYLVIMLIFAVYYEGGRFLWQPQLVGNGVEVYQLGVLFAFFKLFSIGGSVFAKKVSLQKFKRPLMIAGFVVAVTFVMMSSSIVWLIIAAFCVYSFVENYTRVVQSDYLNQAITSNRASFLSLNSIIRNGYSAALTPFLGAIAVTQLAKGFIFLAVIQIIATIAVGILVHDKKRTA